MKKFLFIVLIFYALPIKSSQWSNKETYMFFLGVVSMGIGMFSLSCAPAVFMGCAPLIPASETTAAIMCVGGATSFAAGTGVAISAEELHKARYKQEELERKMKKLKEQFIGEEKIKELEQRLQAIEMTKD